MFGFRARCQDKLLCLPGQTTASSALGLPAFHSLGPGLPQGQLPCPSSGVGTEWLKLLLLGRGSVADGCPVVEVVTGVPI